MPIVPSSRPVGDLSKAAVAAWVATMSARSSTDDRDVQKDPTFCMQEDLKDHYEYVGSTKDRMKVLYKCKHCCPEKWANKSNASNFRRHLEVCKVFLFLPIRSSTHENSQLCMHAEGSTWRSRSWKDFKYPFLKSGR